MRTRLSLASLLVLAIAAPAVAREPLRVERKDAQAVTLVRDDTASAAIWLSKDTVLDSGDSLVIRKSRAARIELALPETERGYVIVQRGDGSTQVAAERVLPLQQGSNFRDIGGYVTKDGKTVRWGRAFRSGAMPLLTEADYALLGQLHLAAVVDLRSLEEREVAPDYIDDRTGALFLSNDYSLRPMFAKFGAGDGENLYSGMEEMLAPQLRSLFKELLADDGGVVYHCSAGQDRTGIATALIYDVLGVDRETILKDYHLSTALRRPQFEMPQVDPADYPNNPIVQMYMAKAAKGEVKAEPLFTPSGHSYLAQFFIYLDAKYGGSAGYLKTHLGFTDADLDRLRATLLR